MKPIGHAVFSHVSEHLFGSNPETLKIGTKPIVQFRQTFQEKYVLVESEIQTGRRKPIAELLTVAIITSKRFEKFYSLLPDRTDTEAFVELCDISTLVLGDRIEANDFALPEILSGPVDADKIDYMIRDAQACGISIGVDVARVFVRAGTYEGLANSVENLQLKGFSKHEPIRLFVIEQSGTDAVRELGSARLSLYERVYNHQLTRGAQAAFNEMILIAAESRDPAISKFGDYLTLWQTPEDVVLYPRAHDSTPPSALVVRGDRIERFGDRYFSYLYAGETSSQIGYLLVSEEWREIALVAFQNILYKYYVEEYQIQIETGSSEAEADIRRPALRLDGLFRPSLQLEGAARTSKLRVGNVEEITAALSKQGYYDAIPHLCHVSFDSDIEAIAARFSEFSGEQGWKIETSHVAFFISQFPPKLRAEIIALLKDKGRFLFLNRTETIDLVIGALSKISVPKPVHLVPLSPSSGQYIRTHIRSALAQGYVHVHSTLLAALDSVAANGGSVVFVDDNIASGTQASRQLDIYMGGRAEKSQGNYFIEKLIEKHEATFRKCIVGAAFAVGYEDGRKKLLEMTARHKIQLDEQNICWGTPLEKASGKKSVSEPMRSFLRDVGSSLLERKFQREGHENYKDLAAKFALGYSALEGLLVTSFSVPTSTYPAFWCPGFRQVLPADGNAIKFPWVPLFLRTDMLQHLVLG